MVPGHRTATERCRESDDILRCSFVGVVEGGGINHATRRLATVHQGSREGGEPSLLDDRTGCRQDHHLRALGEGRRPLGPYLGSRHVEQRDAAPQISLDHAGITALVYDQEQGNRGRHALPTKRQQVSSKMGQGEVGVVHPDGDDAHVHARTTLAGVAVVVVTFRAVDDLEECLRRIAGQTARPSLVIVVDNSAPSAGDASALQAILGEVPLTLLEAETNTGPAGGHAEGLTYFLATGLPFVWIMDDDTMARRETLEALLAEAESGRTILPRRVDARYDREVQDFSWSGALLSRETVVRAGLPVESLFWWVEDTEYLRVRVEAVSTLRRCEHAQVIHTAERRRSGRPPWKTYYEVRNTLWYLLFVKRPLAVRKVVRSTSRQFARAAFVERSGAHITMGCLGLLRGLVGSLGRVSGRP